MTRHTATRRGRSATLNITRSDIKVSSLVRTALRQCLREKRVTVRQAPLLWGCSKATVERDISKGFEIRPLRSAVTAECFARNLLALVLMRDATPTAGYVLSRGAHGRKVPRKTKMRNPRKRSAKKRDGGKRGAS